MYFSVITFHMRKCTTFIIYYFNYSSSIPRFISLPDKARRKILPLNMRFLSRKGDTEVF